MGAGEFLNSLDFWEGMEQLWRLDAKELAVVAGGVSGVWPLLKNMTFAYSRPSGDLARPS